MKLARKEEKIDVPVLFGENNEIDKSFYADGLSSRAKRPTQNTQKEPSLLCMADLECSKEEMVRLLKEYLDESDPDRDVMYLSFI